MARRVLLRNVVSNLVGQGLLLGLLFAAGRYLYRAMGADAFGVVFFSLTLATTLSTALDLGLGATAVREVSAHRHHEPDYVRGLLRTGGLICWLAYLVLAGLMVAAAPALVKHWVQLGALDPARATSALRWLGVGGLLALPRSLYTGVLRGLERMDLSNALDVGCMAVQQAGTVLLARGGASLETVVAWVALSQAGWCLAHAAAVGLLLGRGCLAPGWAGAAVRRNLGFSAHLTLVSVLAVVHTQADRLIASHLLPLAAFGSYAFGYGGVARATLLTGAVGNAAYPSFATLFARGDGPALRLRYARLQEALCLGMVPLFAAVPFLVIVLGGLVFDPVVARGLLLPLSLVALGFYMNGTITLPHVFALAAGRPDISVRLNLYALPLVLPLTAILIGQLGLAGAGASWVAYHVLAYLYAVPRLCREVLLIPLARWFAPVLRAAGVAALVYGPAFVCGWRARPQGLALVIAWAAASTVYGVVALRTCAPELRAVLAGVAAGLRPAEER